MSSGYWCYRCKQPDTARAGPNCANPGWHDQPHLEVVEVPSAPSPGSTLDEPPRQLTGAELYLEHERRLAAGRDLPAADRP